ncbi:hypothetical protein [Nocardioides marinquilinus]|uniref:hypothetical protein n=1 Tax=Nocardioides marinquilinus TaxID=1210400 RepID=UPI0031ED249D
MRLEPGDAPALAMENELLRYEITHLRARLAAAEERDQRRDREVQEWRERQEAKAGKPAGDAPAAQGGTPQQTGQSGKPGHTGKSGKPGKPGKPAKAGQHRDAGGAARDDLVWLLQRLEGTPAAPLLRRRSGYRRLVETYLRDGA